jgi:uncharacterized phosphosugar-binding protein
VDVVIDNHMPVGDAIVELQGLSGAKVGPSSTMVNAFTINSLVLSAMEAMVARGITPPVWVSANMPGGDEINAKYLEEYGSRIKHL